jgi:hypothetical protein
MHAINTVQLSAVDFYNRTKHVHKYAQWGTLLSLKAKARSGQAAEVPCLERGSWMISNNSGSHNVESMWMKYQKNFPQQTDVG